MWKVFVTFVLIRYHFVLCPLDIVKWHAVPIESVPYQVSLNANYWPFLYADHICGGVIISSRFILTAAHCFDKTVDVVIRAGTEWSTWWGDIYRYEQIIKHPNYTMDTRYENSKNDIALMKVNRNIEFSNKVKAVKMAEKSFPASDNLIVKTSGFGLLCLKCKDSEYLLEMTLSTLVNEKCKKKTQLELNNTICAIDALEKSTSK